MAGDASRANGARGGRPRGRKNDSTISKEQAREAVRALVIEHMRPMVEAQIAAAKGLSYLVLRDKKTGKFVPVTEELLKKHAAGDEQGELIEQWEKVPSTPAFTDLLNRALDKPKEQEQDINHKGALRLIHEVPA